MIDFPCDFPIKIIFNNVPGAKEEIVDILNRHHPELTESAIKLQLSQNGSYASITVSVTAKDQASLNQLYQDLTQNSHTKMVL